MTQVCTPMVHCTAIEVIFQNRWHTPIRQYKISRSSTSPAMRPYITGTKIGLPGPYSFEKQAQPNSASERNIVHRRMSP